MSKYDCRAEGMFWSISWLMLVVMPECSASTTGDSPVTVIDCSTLPTLSWMSICSVRPTSTRTPSRRTVPKPCSEKVRTYSPSGRFSNRYKPCESVTSTAAPPIRDGLAASTVTPARMAPDSSLTKPRRPPVDVCAPAVAASALVRISRDNQRVLIRDLLHAAGLVRFHGAAIEHKKCKVVNANDDAKIGRAHV